MRYYAAPATGDQDRLWIAPILVPLIRRPKYGTLSIMGALGAFASHLIDHWLFLVGLLLMIEPFLDYNIARYKEWADRYVSGSRRTLYAVGISIFSVMIACFLAFQDEYDQLQMVQGQTYVQRHPPHNAVAEMDDFLKTPGAYLSLATASQTSPIYITSSSDNDSEEYEYELWKDFIQVGLNVRTDGQSAQSSGETGIMVVIVDPDHPSSEAATFMSMLNRASIPFRTEKWLYRDGWPAVPDFCLFVTREQPAPN